MTSCIIRTLQSKCMKSIFKFHICTSAVPQKYFTSHSAKNSNSHFKILCCSSHLQPSVCGWHGVYSHQYTCFARNWSSKEHERNTEVEVYYGNLTPQIRSVKIFSLVTSATGLAAQPLLLQKAAELNSLGLGIAIGSFVGFFTFITPFLLHWMTKKYVTHLRYNPETEKYTATTITFLLGNKKTTFTASDVTVPEVPGMFTTFLVQNKTALFVDPRLFNHPEHYARLMGYDKPLDFKLESVTQDENPSSKN